MIRSISCVCIFIITLISGFLVYRKQIRVNYKLSYYITIVFVSFALASLVSYINPYNYGNVIIYFVALAILPYVKASRDKAKHDEAVFNDVIILCNDVASSLKQNMNVYHSLQIASQDIKEPLKTDIFDIMNILQEEKTTAIKSLHKFQKKYNFCILKQLGIIIIQFHYNNDAHNRKILETFQDDITLLSEAVKENQTKRKLLRFQYIALSLGSSLAMYSLCSQIKAVFEGNENSLSTMMLVFYIVIIIVLFLVDVYFNNNITKE